MTMQMIVTNQKTKSMRPASRDAGCGSHGSRTATAAAMPPASVPRPTRVRIWLLRTTARLIEPATARRHHPLHLRYPPNRKRRETSMGLGVGIFLAAVGAVLAFAVNTDVSGVN